MRHGSFTVTNLLFNLPFVKIQRKERAQQNLQWSQKEGFMSREKYELI